MKRYYYLSSPGWGWYDDVHPLAQREVFMNGNKIDIGTSTLGSAIGKISSARLEIEDDLCDSTHLGINLDPRGWADCDEAGWFPTDPITLRITQGKDFIEFYNKATGNFLGDEIFIDQFVQWEDIRLGWGIDWEKDALDDIVLKQINPVPQDSVPLNLIVEASINELIFETEYEFFPDSFSILTWQYPEVIYSGQTVDIQFEIFNYCESFPEEAEINIEIIEGNEYGGLIDPYTEETVQSIMAIEHYEGYSYFQYKADGAAVDSLINVVVRISTTDPDLPHLDYNITIHPSQIVIITEPENLIPGELTNIIIKKREIDGTIVDFPPEQTFEVGMLDGCPIGNIIAGGDTNKYFYDITQPVYFLTDSSADSGTVKLIIGLIEDGGVVIGSNTPHLEGDESNTDTIKSKKEILKERLVSLKSMKKGKKENKINLVVPGEEEEFCFSDVLISTIVKIETLQVRERCQQDEIECTSFEPQIFPKNVVSVLKENQDWHWINRDGIPKKTNSGNACKEGARTDCAKIRFGFTYTIREIGKYSNLQDKYLLAEDLKFNPCLDRRDYSNQMWYFNIENIRVPIFSDMCPDQPKTCGWNIDLIDGTNEDTLAKYITNLSKFKEVIKASIGGGWVLMKMIQKVTITIS